MWGLPPPSSPTKRQRVAATPEELVTVHGNPTLRSSQFGPYLEKYGLFEESGVRRHFGSNASGASSSNEEIPPWVLDAHRKANYQQIVASVMGNNARSQFNSLPQLVQDVIVHMALVCSSCWQNLDRVVNDVYNTWWRVWAHASMEVRNPVSLGEQNVVVFMMKSNFGVPWIALERALSKVNAMERGVQFRVEEVWVYRESALSDKICADVIHQSVCRPRGSLKFLSNVEEFPIDVAQNINSIKTFKWISVMPLSLNREKEVAGVEMMHSPHSVENRCIWKWYCGLQRLHRELGVESGINILGSVQNFVGQMLADVAYFFGPPRRTNPAFENRASRPIMWFVSPSGPPIPNKPPPEPFDNTAPMQWVDLEREHGDPMREIHGATDVNAELSTEAGGCGNRD